MEDCPSEGFSSHKWQESQEFKCRQNTFWIIYAKGAELLNNLMEILTYILMEYGDNQILSGCLPICMPTTDDFIKRFLHISNAICKMNHNQNRWYTKKATAKEIFWTEMKNTVDINILIFFLTLPKTEVFMASWITNSIELSYNRIKRSWGKCLNWS